MKVINFWGGPCAGKSTTAAGVFYKSKILGYKCEIVSEYAKQMTYEDRKNILQDQVYILAKQNRKLEMLRDKVDFAITDSPLPLGILYQPENYYEHYTPLVMEIFNSYDNINILLTSTKGLGYQSHGRNQTEEEARELQNTLIDFLSISKIDYETVDMDPDDSDGNLSTILNIIDNNLIGNI